MANINISNISNVGNTTGSTPSSPAAPVVDYVGFVSVPLLLVFGVGGNILTIIVMRSKPFKRFPSSYVLICLAFSDSVLNVLLPFHKPWVRELLGTDIRSYSESGCQAFFWAFRTAKMTSSWFVVLICVERFVAVCFPLKAPIVNRKRFAVVGITLIYLVIGTYNGVWVTFADRLVGGVCRPNTQPPGLVHVTRTFLIVGLSIYSFVPSLILIVLTTLIIIHLYSARRARRSMMASLMTDSYEDPTSKTTLMLLCIIFAFVILVMPIAVAHLIFFIKRQPIFEAKGACIVVFREVATLLEHINYSINFLLYVVACPSFRNHLPVIFCCWRRRQYSLGNENVALQDSSGSDKSRSSAITSTGRKGSAGSLQVHRVDQ